MKLKSPFPYFGGKASVAHLVWDALGNVDSYIEPLFGSGAVLLARPFFDPQKHSETVNDADGNICNVWRSLQFNPDEVAKWCDWPVNHADLSSRKLKIIENKQRLLDNLIADPDWFDAKLAGYWIYAASCWIGSGLTSIGQRPHLGNKGKGVHTVGHIPHLSDKGTGVHAIGKIPSPDENKNVQDPYNTNIYTWFRRLSERLRYVRVVCGDWSRVCGGDWQDKAWKTVGVFFDPPYAVEDRQDVYDVDSHDIAHDIRRWAIERGVRSNYRIVIAGYEEHQEELTEAGWRMRRWKTGGGYANLAGKDNSQGKVNRRRECLYFSPHCLKTELFE